MEATGGASGKPEGVHLVGSVPLADEDAVFHAGAEILGDRLRRLPDGETGPRSIWIAWQGQVFADSPDLEVQPVPEGEYAPLTQHRLRDGADPATMHLESLGYADAAQSSWERFDALQSSGIIPPELRFQVSLPTPLAPVSQFVIPGDRARVEPVYTDAMIRDVRRILANIPHDRLAIQWDVAIEMGMLEHLGGLFEPWFDDVEGGIEERFAQLGELVPEDVEMGLHLCYGDFGHEHFTQPADAGLLTRTANRAAAVIGRRLDWVHLPVPADRDDDAYFAPLAGLELAPGTELYLGLVHLSDGTEGAERRIAAARHAVTRPFGIATECGFGRRPPETVAPLMELHRALSAPVARA